MMPTTSGTFATVTAIWVIRVIRHPWSEGLDCLGTVIREVREILGTYASRATRDWTYELIAGVPATGDRSSSPYGCFTERWISCRDTPSRSAISVTVIPDSWAAAMNTARRSYRRRP